MSPGLAYFCLWVSSCHSSVTCCIVKVAAALGVGMTTVKDWKLLYKTGGLFNDSGSLKMYKLCFTTLQVVLLNM